MSLSSLTYCIGGSPHETLIRYLISTREKREREKRSAKRHAARLNARKRNRGSVRPRLLITAQMANTGRWLLNSLPTIFNR
jgi:hypothetical protein